MGARRAASTAEAGRRRGLIRPGGARGAAHGLAPRAMEFARVEELPLSYLVLHTATHEAWLCAPTLGALATAGQAPRRFTQRERLQLQRRQRGADGGGRGGRLSGGPGRATGPAQVECGRVE